MRILKNYKAKISIDFVNLIYELLEKIPKEHVIGIDRVLLVDRILDDGVAKLVSRDAGYVLGAYIPKDLTNPAVIEIAVGAIYKNFPGILCYFPFVKEYLFARTFYREIGHHCQSHLHSVPKEQWESFAKNYSKKMTRRAFKKIRLTFYPIRPLILLFKKIIKKRMLKRSIRQLRQL